MASKSLEFNCQGDTRPVKLFFQDEARFGRIDSGASCWVPKGCRAKVGSQIIRQYTYLYGAFCPETGEQFSLILPKSDYNCMNIFLNEFSREFNNYRVIMGMDNAPWHSKYSEIDNIVPLFHPPYSPELNPAEHIWEYVRELGGFKNKTFNSMKEVEDRLAVFVNTHLADKDAIKSITGFKWILKAL